MQALITLFEICFHQSSQLIWEQLNEGAFIPFVLRVHKRKVTMQVLNQAEVCLTFEAPLVELIVKLCLLVKTSFYIHESEQVFRAKIARSARMPN